jgi:hypothetical protein
MHRTLITEPLLATLLGAGCVSAGPRTAGAVTFLSEAKEPTAVEIVLAPRGSAGEIAWLRAQEAAEVKLRIVTSFRATLFEDLDGNGGLDDGDRVLDTAYGTTELPSWYIQVSPLTIPAGTALSRVRVLAEVQTTLGSQSTVFGLQ